MQVVSTSESKAKPTAAKANGKGRQRAGSSAAKQTLHLKDKHVTATKPSTDDLAGMIATAAYFLAERRSFEPGHELEDWLTAEERLRSLYS